MRATHDQPQHGGKLNDTDRRVRPGRDAQAKALAMSKTATIMLIEMKIPARMPRESDGQDFPPFFTTKEAGVGTWPSLRTGLWHHRKQSGGSILCPISDVSQRHERPDLSPALRAEDHFRRQFEIHNPAEKLAKSSEWNFRSWRILPDRGRGMAYAIHGRLHMRKSAMTSRSLAPVRTAMEVLEDAPAV